MTDTFTNMNKYAVLQPQMFVLINICGHSFFVSLCTFWWGMTGMGESILGVENAAARLDLEMK